jgi:hypothetical protein
MDSHVKYEKLVQKDTNRAHTTPQQPGHPHTT